MKIKKNPEKENLINKLSRRKFIGRCTTCTAGISLLPPLSSTAWGFPSLLSIGNNEKVKIKLIFAHPSPEEPNWPNIGYDFKGRIKELNGMFQKNCPDIEFITNTVTSGTVEVANEILSDDKEVDGYIVYLVGCLWGDLSETIAASGKPTIFVDDLFAGSGEFLTSYARVKRKGLKVIGVSSSRFEDVIEAVRCIECLKKLRSSTVLVVGGEPDKQIEEVYGTKMKKIEFNEINEAYQKVDINKAKNWANRWISEAEKVVEPSHKEIEKAAAMYLAMYKLMQQHHAQGITVNCLGGIYSGNMVPAYPCLGFMQLDNDGLVGGCEADQRSAITKLLMSYLAGRPGFISDPVIDTAKNQIIYAHCVAPTKVFGPEGTSNPFHIRSHSEDRKGACNRSLLPLGEMTTTIQFDHRKKQVILHQGKSVANIDEDKACRTKLAVEVEGDIFKLLNYWDEWGWHRVTFFGDLKHQVYNIALLLGFEIIEEA